ncbi:ABC transporter permease [Corynebacterium sp. ES2794-CONJ1]|uniref:ABC transporter permease n=1 Tax=unclassified Corynebacterium TaxID=2624378 RepID=UPI0021677E20|nr:MULTISPECIES: ABC transporter permease [unclassified Corynebacterium]MCS4490569.1 ABC transporter permease [Corynebacterium sp. ES2775-CONJ]MCS4492348.1 ABC transporter permease [Corynebacterium sp. ES2715-CONJ3]MCS4532460.1 ABC transporter permease [Corynebacterium sp. ES2730-CONJ]MCU9519855.1 ABC transporter permease [Corynebacterium sp. ES2794-CONJ1]
MLDYYLLSIKRPFKDTTNVILTSGLPVALYIIFGAAQDYQGVTLKGGNVEAYILIGLALYGGVVAAVNTAGSAVVDQNSGWGRMMATTPLRLRHYIAAQICTIFAFTMLPVAAVLATGYMLGARMDEWILTFFVTVAVAVPFGFYGLLWASFLPSSTSITIATTSIVLLAFLGNLFMPMPEAIVRWGEWTPMFGSGVLARYFVAEGSQFTQDAGLMTTSLALAFANFGIWTTILVTGCIYAATRDKNRA